ncbi:MAG: cephalosporin hydroxylase [Myxococcales bacterium]|nr:cephalosporin hydroxylase [Myxococcales bacterium]
MTSDDKPDDRRLKELTREWFLESCRQKYSYRFSWMGRPIIQYPQDIVAMQELIFRVQPDLIVETGIAHGGSLVFYASMLELLGGERRVLGVDIDIRAHNRAAIEAHPMFKRIDMIEGSSIDAAIVARVHEAARGKKSVLLVLDSNHTHDHVLAELRAYASLVTKDSYCVVFDTVVEDMPDEFFPDRPWRQGNSPKSAVHAFLKESDRFEIDRSIDDRILITVSPDGFLRCVR